MLEELLDGWKASAEEQKAIQRLRKITSPGNQIAKRKGFALFVLVKDALVEGHGMSRWALIERDDYYPILYGSMTLANIHQSAESPHPVDVSPVNEIASPTQLLMSNLFSPALSLMGITSWSGALMRPIDRLNMGLSFNH
ncbi:MAG: hypothetical protein ACE5PV_12005, partial [Candidatus Poribacteria bacterium]